MYAPVVREGMTMVSSAPFLISTALIASIQSAYGIGKVVLSRSTKWKVGDLVVASMGWREYSVWHEDKVRPVPNIAGHSPTLALSALGGTGLTAWFGLYNVCQTKPEHTVVISGAAG
jgi:NADPH-dependent curcumin reductase CurA